MKRTILIFAAALFFTLPLSAVGENSLTLLWEADTSVPPFYRGKPLPSSGSTVRVVALPEISAGGKAVKVEDLTFNWTKDEKNITSASGKSKNILVFAAGPEGGVHRVSVSAASADGKTKVSREVLIRVSAPKLVIYEDDPLAGVNYRRAAEEEINLFQPEITLVAEPFFFSRGGLGRGLEYDWRLDGKKIITDPANQPLITFVAPTEGSGENSITVLAKNLANPLQSARRQFKIRFGIFDFSF